MHIDQCPRKQLSVSNTWAFRSEGSLVGVFSAIMSIVRKVRRRAMTLIRRVLLTWIIISIGAVLVLRRTFSDYQVDESLNELPNEIAELSFQGFDNETGVDHFIVPNIIHFIRFNQSEVSFVDYICILAAFRNHRPDFIYIHSDSPIEQFHGKYWNWIRNNVDLYSIIRVFHVDLPSHVFGQKISDKWRVWHGSDVTRLGILMKYGGIYLDNDVYVIKSLDKYRKFEAVVNWDDGDDVGNNLIIAHRNARVLPLWLDTYRDYRSNLWYYNGGKLPTQKVLVSHPELIHRVKVYLGFDTDLTLRLYWDKKFPWRKLDAIHLNMRSRRYMDPTSYEEFPYFDEENVQRFQFPFGEMARELIGTW